MVQEKKEIGQRQRYPALSLEEAIQKARTVFDHVQRSSASTEKVASYWKYGLKSSGWRLSLAALKQYGLLESVGSKKSGEVKLTDLALRIILDSREQSTERDQAIKEAALRPQIYRELWNHWNGNLPSKDVIQTYLAIEKGFGPGAIPNVIADFMKTISFAELTPLDIMPPARNSGSGDDEDDEDDDHEQGHKGRRRQMQAGTKEDVFTLDEGQVILQWPERLSQESFEDFESWLELVIKKVKRSVGKETDEE